MKILIDADACPVVDITIETGRKYGVKTIIFCDEAHKIDKSYAETVYVSQGNDSVDFVLLRSTEQGDIVVTQDFGLASMVLAKKAAALNQNGLIYNQFNIDQLLFTRHISKKIRNNGGRTKGPKKREKSDDENFEKSLGTLLKKSEGIR